MNDTIYKIDITNLDNEIETLEDSIKELTAKKAIKLELKEYIIKNAVPLNGGSNGLFIKNGKENEDLYKKVYGGVSDFILSYLRSNPGADSKSIINAYAKNTNQKYEDISNNISNALSRLKTAFKINGEEKAGGRKAGFKWYLVEQLNT